jgi:hypothetical protein
MVRVERLRWEDVALAALALPRAELRLTLGLGSGLTARGGRIFAVTDRGPNLHLSTAVEDYGLVNLAHLRGIKDAKVMPIPDEGPEIAELVVEGGAVRLVARMALRTASGARINGRALLGSAAGAEMEQVFDLVGAPLAPSALGADTEAIAALPGGGFVVAEEYGPSLLCVDASGVVSERWVARGSEAVLAGGELPVRGVLPERVARRRLNRGIEALCASADGAHLYVGMQSALVGEDERTAPVWKLDAVTGAVLGEWLYPFDAPETFARDAARRKVRWSDLKICEFAWVSEDKLLVLERIAHSAKVYVVDLARVAEKRLVLSSDEHAEIGADIEGMALLSDDELLLSSDNDFGVEGDATGFLRISGLRSRM